MKRLTKKEKSFLRNFYYARNRKTPEMGWYNELNDLYQSGRIKKFVKIYNQGYLGQIGFAFLRESNRIMCFKHEINDVNTAFMMDRFKEDIRISWEEITGNHAN